MRFLCLGDSLTAGYPGYSRSEDGILMGYGNYNSQYEFWLKECCIDYLERNLGAVPDDIYDELIFINKGNPGELTSNFLSRIDRDMLRISPKPDYSIIIGGTNDLGWGVSNENILMHIKELHDISRDQKIPSIGGTIPPIRDEQRNKSYNEQKVQLNNLFKEFFNENNIPFADLYEGMSDSEGNLKDEYAYFDGLHFSVAGYRQMGRTIFRDAVKEIITREFL